MSTAWSSISDSARAFRVRWGKRSKYIPTGWECVAFLWRFDRAKELPCDLAKNRVELVKLEPFN
jgi:hypothetical protein